ncbi:MAG: OmpA family protein [Chitinophagaceae bacterium]|nr:OmpA family protein [Chitinophagaceae bacterium]
MKIKHICVLLFLAAGGDTVIAQGNDTLTQVYSKFDFVPGEKIIFYDDFSGENIGDFPARWNTNGSGEIVTYGKLPGKWFKITNNRGAVCLADALTLPENYTIEFDLIPQKDPANNGNPKCRFLLISTPKPKDVLYGLARPGGTGVWFEFAYSNSYFTYYSDGTPNLSGRITENRLEPDRKYRISIWVQKERIRLYLDEKKLFDLAKAMSPAFKYNMIRFDGGVPIVGNVRVATGLPDMRNKLLSTGKLVSYGIYFDVNSDVIKPQSAGTLKEIAGILQETPGLNLRITGFTDSDGDDAFNLDLSRRRAAAVKQALVSSYGIEAARLETDGKGEKDPVAPNDNSNNKALNRRVEFVKR